MPSEKFYNKHAVEGQHPEEMLEVSWGRNGAEWGPTVMATLQVGRHVSAISMDRSAVNRLIKALRKARDQTFGEDA